MDVSAHRKVTGEFDKLREALLGGPANWMPGMYQSDTGTVTELEVDTPFGRLARFARMEVGVARIENKEVVVPITWHSLEAEKLFPVFQGMLRLSRAPDGSRLELEGRYKPPGGAAGRAADAVGMAGIAQATVDDFVERVAAVLSRNALGRSVAEQVDSGTLTLDSDPLT